MLTETIDGGRLSHIVVNGAVRKYELTGQDRAFVSRLYLGVLERYVYLEYVINLYSKTKTKKMKPAIRNILMLSLQQMLFMDSVPDFAAVNEAGRLTRSCGLAGLVPFVNGVLRAAQRDFDKKEKEAQMPSWVKLSVPEWMYREVSEEYGKEKAEKFFKAALAEKEGVCFSVNLNSILKELYEERITEIIKMLEALGCSVSREEVPGCLRVKDFGSIEDLVPWKAGMITVQDPSAVCSVLEGVKILSKIKEDPFIIDVCAAPGGKSMIAAEHFPAGRVLARDISQAKIDLINENTVRMGFENIETEVFDALVPDPELKEKADMVIADLPCSGIGVIGGKPDIKLRLKQGDIAQLAQKQRDILDVCGEYVRPGGILLYSTCTITKAENSDNRKWFSKNHPFKCVKEEQLLPENGDAGFYTAVFKKEK